MGEVQHLEGDSVIIHWYRGSKTQKWTKGKVIMARGRQENDIEHLNASSIVSPPFQLANTLFLPKKVQRMVEELTDQ